MSDQFLILIVEKNSLKALVCDHGPGKKALADICTIHYDDQPRDNTYETPFEQAVPSMAAELDLSSCRTCVILLSSDQCYFRTTRLPFKTPGKVMQVLPLELESTFPVEDLTCISDFTILDPEPGTDLFEVFSSSIEEEKIAGYVAAMNRLGIKPLVISPKGPSLAAAFLKLRADLDSFIFLTPENQKISATLVVQQKIAGVRTFSADPNTLEKELKRMIMGFSQQHRFCLNFDLILATENSISSIETALFNSMENTLAYQERLAGPEQIRQQSDPAPLPACEKIPAQKLFSFLSPDREPKGMFNFCKGKYGSDSFFKTHAKDCIISSCLALVVFVFFMMTMYTQINEFEKKITDKKQAASSIFSRSFPGKTMGNLDPLLAMKAAVKSAEKKTGSTAKDALPDPSGLKTVEILYELSVRVPPSLDMDITRLILDKERLILSGSTKNFNTVDQIKSMIEKSEIFKTVEISSAAAKRDGNRVEFKFIVGM